ncbi:MAG TPA: ComEC/Rec2 family competence protein [Solirubrobacterales bacterium]|nr:ComEC/Rec2 family competence protein [Solirubrobacterales bacterium]
MTSGVRGGRPAWPLALAIAALALLALGHRGEIRGRAERALGSGMPAREAALARGFVLGEDDRIDEATVEDFRRAGLSHLLAVSGQNVALLALLAMPLLAALGMPLRTRLVWILAAIAVYVPLAGGGPSIVRAGVMGALSLLATLAGRRASRLYALAVAAVVTVAIDPGIAADVGWQLSFAAVLGILALAAPLRAALAERIGARGWRGALAEGAAVTIAATLATAPLIAFHFEALSTTTLLANLLALPAVAPAMWLGMLTAIGAQVPGFPAVVPNALAAPLLAYIAAVARWCGRPGWAYLDVHLGPGGLVGSYALLTAAALGLPALLRHRRLAALRRDRRSPVSNALPSSSIGNPLRLSRLRLAVAVALLAALLGLNLAASSGSRGAPPPHGLRVSVLDVGQGDAILLQPARAAPILVDGGPPGGALVAKLREAGVGALGVVVATHEQSDHTGGIGELLGDFAVGELAYARLGRDLRAEAAAARVDATRLAAGDTIRSGGLRLEVIWPPPALLTEPLGAADPNAQALVLLARWHRFTMLLSADAEAGEVPVDPGPVDVLKVAHHGSEDAGLDALLDRTSPSLAVISVGGGNSYGHPAPSTLATLASHEISLLRTDEAGNIVIDAGKDSFAVAVGG